MKKTLKERFFGFMKDLGMVLLMILGFFVLAFILSIRDTYHPLKADGQIVNSQLKTVLDFDINPSGYKNGVYRFIDNEAGVVCWIYLNSVDNADRGGISCLPINYTRLAP